MKNSLNQSANREESVETRSDLTKVVREHWNTLPRGTPSDLPTNFGNSFVTLATNMVDGAITFGGAFAPLEAEDTRKLRESQIQTKYGLIGTVLGYTTMTAVGAYIMSAITITAARDF